MASLSAILLPPPPSPSSSPPDDSTYSRYYGERSTTTTATTTVFPRQYHEQIEQRIQRPPINPRVKISSSSRRKSFPIASNTTSSTSSPTTTTITTPPASPLRNRLWFLFFFALTNYLFFYYPSTYPVIPFYAYFFGGGDGTSSNPPTTLFVKILTEFTAYRFAKYLARNRQSIGRRLSRIGRFISISSTELIILLIVYMCLSYFSNYFITGVTDFLEARLLHVESSSSSLSSSRSSFHSSTTNSINNNYHTNGIMTTMMQESTLSASAIYLSPKFLFSYSYYLIRRLVASGIVLLVFVCGLVGAVVLGTVLMGWLSRDISRTLVKGEGMEI